MKDFVISFIHLYSAIIFVGYVFFDCVICSKFTKANEIKKIYFKNSGIIYAMSFILLILTGIMLAINNFNNFSYMAKIIFFIKIALIVFMIFVTLLSIIIFKQNKNSNNFLVKQAHNLALLFCILIVLAAKFLYIL